MTHTVTVQKFETISYSPPIYPLVIPPTSNTQRVDTPYYYSTYYIIHHTTYYTTYYTAYPI